MIAITSVLDSYITYLSKQIIDDGNVAGTRAFLKQKLLCTVAFRRAGGDGLLLRLPGRRLGERVQYDNAPQAVSTTCKHSRSRTSQDPVGWIMSRVTSDAERNAELVTWGLVDITWSALNTTTR
jgi:ATP-binding cassette subfamily B protein